MSDFERYITEEKERLMSQRVETQKGISELQDQLREIDKELKAVEAYETAKKGKPERRRARSRKSEILTIVKNSQGVTRAQVIDALGDPEAGQAVSNTLSQLKKSGEIKAEDGVYSAK